MVLRASAPAGRTRKRAAPAAGKPSVRRRLLQLERLEDRVTPSLLGAFELDGNAQTGVLGTSGSTTTSHDWDQVFTDAGSPALHASGAFTRGPTSLALAGSFVSDELTGDDIFTTGSTKDTLPVSGWLFKTGAPQPKDEITDAYAAAYTDPNSGHLLLYAGLDRFSNSGDSTAGFWFFKNPVGKSTNGIVGGSGAPFTGTHSDGDVLLISNFTIGGSVSTIAVYKWVGNDATGSLQLVGSNAADTFAIVNSAPISVPWSYTAKTGQAGPQAGEFLEEGVDLTDLGLNGCFSSFLAETRSSQSPTATLSDFVTGNFQLCSLAAPEFTGISKVGDSITYPLTVQNTGASPLFIQSVSDTLLGNIVVNHTLQQPGAAGVTSISTSFDFSQPLAPGASLTIFVTRTVQSGDPDPTTSTVTFVGTDDLAGLDDPIAATATNSVNLFQPHASLTETVSPTSATSLGQVITYTFTVANTSSSDSPNLILDTSNPNDSFTDTLLGNLEPAAIAAATGGSSSTFASIAPGASFMFSVTRAIQAGDPTPLTDTSTAAFTLAQNLGSFTNIIHASGSASVTLLPHLEITKTVTSGFPDVIHPGDTASFTITVSNDGAGPATNVQVTDQLPAADQLTWTVTPGSSTFDTASISPGDFLTAFSAALAAGATESVTVSALIPLDIFGPTGGGTGSGDVLAAGVFELDGNATTGVLGTSGSTTTSHDWDQVFNDVTNGTSTSGAISASFVTDAVNTTGDNIFTGGGSKDTNGIQQGPWQFTDSKPQAKDDIGHAYAATYTDPSNGHVLLFTGMDRFDNSGDATAGFWFLQNPVGLSTSNPTSSGSPFTGTHQDGDILLVSDFTIGGSTSTIKVFRWTGNDATGSLVPVAAPGTTTFAIVNSGPIAVPWSFMDKSHNTTPAAGEFLEEGVDLTALGLGGCFSNFLAETRSSQSPTATLSDFVIGNFNTCKLPLPNTANVQADGIPPITSNEVLITVNDGHALEATSLGSGAGTDILTAQQLQLAVAQATAAWRAAGVDPATMSNLDNVHFRIGNLPGAELGYEVPGTIWIDQNAAGWGWAINGGSGMDLATVVSHEIGHALGFEHSTTGVMEDVLAAGQQRLPEALPDPVAASAAVPAGTVASVVVPVTAPAAFSVGAIGLPQAGVPSSTPAGLGIVEAVLAIGPDGIAAPAFSGTAAVDAVFAATPGFSQAAPVPGGQEGAPLNHAATTPAFLSGADAPPAAVSDGTDPDATGVPAPGVRPPTPPVDNGNGAGQDDDDAGEQAGVPLPPANRADVLLRQHVSDECFTSDSWAAELTHSGTILRRGASSAAGVSAAALAFALVSWRDDRLADSERRKLQRFVIDGI
jgi:uncharacterized repeat protein (TIGR01451 family)